MDVKVSVVVPVYNTEKYLHQCIDSLITQTLTEIELIFVDDGSTDHSVDILEEYREKDTRVHVIKQKNLYAGVARNNGMQIATGKYIMFLDSDDFFKPNMLEECYNAGENNHAEIVFFDYWLYDNVKQKSMNTTTAQCPESVFSYKDLGEDIYQQYIPAPWNKLFLRSFIMEHHLQYRPVKKCNDIYFTFLAAALAKRMFYIPKQLLYYRINNSSSIQGNYANRNSFIECGLDVKKGLQEKGLYNDSLKKSFEKTACILIHNGESGITSNHDQKEYYLFVKQNLVPKMFDNEEAFQNDEALLNIHHSTSYEEFLFLELESAKRTLKDMIPPNCPDYKLGKTLLFLPKRISSLVKRIIKE